MDLGLKDKVVIVTGGSKGIGEGIVRSFLAEDASVVIINRSTAEGEALEAEFTELGKNCYFLQGDLTQVEACRDAVGEALGKYGRIDILVNNAGVNDGVGLDAGPEEFLGSIQRNLVHYYAMVHYALDELKKAKGSIINITSKVADTGQGNTSGYAASKGGINALTREWAVDLVEDGVRVNAVVPAEVWTPLYEKWIRTLDNPDETLSQIKSLIPLEARMTTKEEIADMVVFLASSRSSHTTGQIIYVDGGYTHFDRKCTSQR
ncbi:MAG: SDR family oxidoreductase [Planctomycetota bacterium]|jgi:NAD(P)-dependent dehydrogenase (short-subunit alcohol dehydrogenase family)|nr:SDR family oxidoreductase [Planctomycetota bacterium]MDP7129829.1 SDR family oxidoreductase [Planctomycetota bacterium]